MLTPRAQRPTHHLLRVLHSPGLQGALLLPGDLAAAATPQVPHSGGGGLAAGVPAQRGQQQQQTAGSLPPMRAATPVPVFQAEAARDTSAGVQAAGMRAATPSSSLLPAAGGRQLAADAWARGIPSRGALLGVAGEAGGPLPSPFLHQPGSPFLPPTPGGGASLAAPSPLPPPTAGMQGLSACKICSSSSSGIGNDSDRVRGSLASRLLHSLVRCKPNSPTQTRGRDHAAAPAAGGSSLPLHIQLAAALARAAVHPPQPRFVSEDRQPAPPARCLPAAEALLPDEAVAAAAAPAAPPALPDAKPLTPAAQLSCPAPAALSQHSGPAPVAATWATDAVHAAAAAPPAEQGLARHPSPGSVDWAQLLLVR